MKPNDCQACMPEASRRSQFLAQLFKYKSLQSVIAGYLRAGNVSDAIRLELRAREIFSQLIQEGK